eukprot:scaffold80784_cov29-Tisochrysis_lutea.AAC.2
MIGGAAATATWCGGCNRLAMLCKLRCSIHGSKRRRPRPYMWRICRCTPEPSVTAHSVPINGNEGRKLRSSRGGHHLIVHDASYVRTHVADHHVCPREELNRCRERKRHVLVGISPKFHPPTFHKLLTRKVEENEIQLLFCSHLAHHGAIGVVACAARHDKRATNNTTDTRRGRADPSSRQRRTWHSMAPAHHDADRTNRRGARAPPRWA